MTTSTTVDPAPTPDLAAIKTRQQATWSSGDYHMIGTQIQIVSELLIEALDVHSTERVLDVATGSGNAALAAARRGLRRRSASTTSRPCSSAHADGPTPRASTSSSSRATPRRCRSPTASFDVVSSVFGAMFAPDQEQTAARARPRRPAAAAASASSRIRPTGFIGQLFKTIAKHVAAAGRPALADPVGHRGPPARAVRRRRSPTSRARSGYYIFRDRSPEALHRVLAHVLRPDAQGVRGRRRVRPRARSRPTCSSSSAGSTAPTTARWSCRASTSRP